MEETSMNLTKSEMMQVANVLAPHMASEQFDAAWARSQHLKTAFEALKRAGMTREQANEVMCKAVDLLHEQAA